MQIILKTETEIKLKQMLNTFRVNLCSFETTTRALISLQI